MNYEVKITKIPKFPKSILPSLLPSMKKAMLIAERTSKKNYLTGPRPKKLGVVTGRLRSSVKGIASIKNGQLIGVLGSNVKYAPVHELGGMAGRNRSVKMPKRPFLHPAIEENLALYTEMFAAAIKKAIGG